MKFKRNSSNSINSYSDLKNFFRLINFNEKNKMDLSDFAKVGIGCVLLSGSIKNINYFSTNRYLLDAVSAKQIPDYDVLNSDYFVNEIITYFKLPKITGSRSVDSKWSETVKNLIKKINKNEPFKTKKFWNKKRKDFF